MIISLTSDVIHKGMFFTQGYYLFYDNGKEIINFDAYDVRINDVTVEHAIASIWHGLLTQEKRIPVVAKVTKTSGMDGRYIKFRPAEQEHPQYEILKKLTDSLPVSRVR